MKKKTEKELNLGKIKIATLSERNQQTVQGGRINLSITGCEEGGCRRFTEMQCETDYVRCAGL